MLYTELMLKVQHTTVTMSELRDNLSAYLDAAERGVVITVTRRGRPSATLSATLDAPEAIDTGALERFRQSLGVQSTRSVVVELRERERY